MIPKVGGCRCGQVRFEVNEAPLLTMACHCRGCQQMTGGPYSVSTMYPRAGFKVTAGEPVAGGLHGGTHHMHCPHCLSWVYTLPEGADWLVNIRAVMFDDVTGFTPYMETYTDEMLPWAKTPAVRSFPKFPEIEAYQELVSEFMASRASS